MCNNPVLKRIHGKIKDYTILIPCGGCNGCRRDKLDLWIARCNSEYIKYRSAFVTFTYDTNHLIYEKNAPFPTLRKEQFHRYIDNLKHKVSKLPPFQNCTNDFKFFGCGEYGDIFNRPHYHVLFFGLDFHDYKKLFYNTWKNGYIKSLPVLRGGVRYVCDYVSKQVTGQNAVHDFDEKNIERPFMSVSKGLGFDFFFAHRDEIAKTSCIKIGSRVIPVPTYYVNLFTNFTPYELQCRLSNTLDSFRNVLKSMKREGFTDYDKYMNYKRFANETVLAQQARKNGSASSISFHPVYTSGIVNSDCKIKSPLEI